MSKKIDLGFGIFNLEGEEVMETKPVKKDGEIVKEKGENKTTKFPLTLKSMLLILIPVYPVTEKMVDLWDLGLKVKRGDGETEFDNDEFGLMREVIEKNSFPNPVPGGKDTMDRYFPFIIAQVIKYFDKVTGEGAEENKEKLEEKDEKKEE